MSNFQFKPIAGYLSLNEATASLVHIAKAIQSSHKEENASEYDKEMQLHVFQLRADSVRVLMNLITQYLDQIPEK